MHDVRFLGRRVKTLTVVFTCRRCGAGDQRHSTDVSMFPAAPEWIVNADAFKFCERCADILYPDLAALRRSHEVRNAVTAEIVHLAPIVASMLAK